MKGMAAFGLTLALLFVGGSGWAEEDVCSRMAFGGLCLGGPKEALPPGGVSRDGGIAYAGDGYTTFAFLHEDSVRAVSRQYDVETFYEYRQLAVGIADVMDRLPDDGGREVPDYCQDDQDCEEAAIKAGKGQIFAKWDEENYTITVFFDHRGLFVHYHDVALMEAAKKTEKPRF